MNAQTNIRLMPWYRLFDSLLFWQAVWFLYFQAELSGAEAIVLYTVYDVATTVLEVPSGYFSDRIGRRLTLVLSAVCGALGCLSIAFGGSFWMFALGQAFLGASTAFKSGTDSAFLFESLVALDRAEEVEAQELKVWRFSLAGFAISGVTGGIMALWSPALPFFATALTFGIALLLTMRMIELPRGPANGAHIGARIASLKAAMVNPVLAWLFVLAVLMYGFSHLPFIFGQPFVLSALTDIGLAGEAPLVSGAVSSTMMLISVAASLVALRMRQALGLPMLLLLAFGLQIALIGVLTISTSVVAISVLLLRVVPGSLAYPFILARIQPLLDDSTRATYLSLKSLGGKLVFAATLLMAATSAQSAGLLPAADLQRILGWYTMGGLVCFALLGLTALRVAIEAPLEAPK